MSMEPNLKQYIEELISEIQNELDEATATGNVAGYNTPNAFSDKGTSDKNRKKKMAKRIGYTLAGKIDESFMSDLDLIKKGSKDITDFIKKVLSNKDYKEVRTDKEFHKYLKSFYNESVNESNIKGQLAGDSVHHFIKSIGSKFVSGEIKNTTRDGKTYLKLTDEKFGSGVVKILKSRFGIDAKVDYFGGKGKIASTPSVSFYSDAMITESVVNEAKVKRPVNRWLELKNDETMHPHKKMAHGLKELKYQLAETEKFFKWYNKIKNINELESSNYWKRTQNHIYKIKERLVNIARTIQEIEK